MWAKVLSAVVWFAAAAAAVYWGMQLFGRGTAVPAHAVPAPQAQAPAADWARLFGPDAPPPVAAAPQEPPPDARYQLLGVFAAAPAAGQAGVALIAVDGKPARAFRVGAVVDAQTVLQAVHQRGATLGPRGGVAAVSLQVQGAAGAGGSLTPPTMAPAMPPAAQVPMPPGAFPGPRFPGGIQGFRPPGPEAQGPSPQPGASLSSTPQGVADTSGNDTEQVQGPMAEPSARAGRVPNSVESRR